jgi:hypothetical protein
MKLSAILTLAAVSLAPCACLAASNMQVWLSPDNDSPDLIEMFRQPQTWVNARSQIKVFKFGPQQVGGGNPTGANSIIDLNQVNAFKLLHSWGIQVAIESPAIKPWDCKGQVAAAQTLKLAKNVEASGGGTPILSLDEPLAAATKSCGDDLASAARKTASYINTLRRASPNLTIGDIEPYPLNRPSQLKSWVDALEANGAKLDYLQIDPNVHALDVRRDVDVAGDLRNLADYLKSKKLPFGIIFWSGYNPVHSDRAYYDHVMSWVTRVQAAIGAPDQAVFQSWATRSAISCSDSSPSCTPTLPQCGADDPAYCGQKSIPVNLPESSSEVYSHTRLLNDAIRVLTEKTN